MRTESIWRVLSNSKSHSSHLLRLLSTRSSGRIQRLEQLQSNDLETFRETAFTPQLPCLLPRGCYTDVPAISRWFDHPDAAKTKASLKRQYLEQFGNTIVPLELTVAGEFTRVHQPLALLLDSANLDTASDARIYLAQASLSDLPERLRLDLPTPELVTNAGKGDVYDSSIWLGLAPTYTPLHKDPNPNLFIQLAGKKTVRLFQPEIGRAIFAHVQASIGGHASASMRGEEMMQGPERHALAEAVWGDSESHSWIADGFECEVATGDGLFIPKGWWHSIRGFGGGMIGSVNWWFR